MSKQSDDDLRLNPLEHSLTKLEDLKKRAFEIGYPLGLPIESIAGAGTLRELAEAIETSMSQVPFSRQMKEDLGEIIAYTGYTPCGDSNDEVENR